MDHSRSQKDQMSSSRTLVNRRGRDGRLRALRGTRELEGAPLILMVETAPPARRLAELGPVSIARKPIAKDELLAMVRQCLG